MLLPLLLLQAPPVSVPCRSSPNGSPASFGIDPAAIQGEGGPIAAKLQAVATGDKSSHQPAGPRREESGVRWIEASSNRFRHRQRQSNAVD